MTELAILILCVGIAAGFALKGTAELLKALGIEIKVKPAPLTEEEKRALDAYARQQEKMTQAMNNMFGFGGGGDNE